MDVLRRTLLGWIAGSLVLLFGSASQAQSTSPIPPPSSQPGSLPYRSLYQSIEDAASRMKAGDSNSVRDLVDALFAFPGAYPMPQTMAAVVKQKLIDSQSAYLTGKSSGVVEGAVVDALNALVVAFDAPEYARVTALQVRFLRNRLAVGMPVFMSSVPEAKVDETNPPMSPVQALFLMSTLIQQKESNPDYRAAPAEWDRDYCPRLLEQARSADDMWRRVEAGEASYEVRATLSATIGKNLVLILQERIRQMSIIDGLKLFNETYARLGI